jgi:ABC-2 type transport system ATP-binding protein
LTADAGAMDSTTPGRRASRYGTGAVARFQHGQGNAAVDRRRERTPRFSPRHGWTRVQSDFRDDLWAWLALFILAPLVAEYLLGDFPLTYLPLLLVLAPLYGGAALVIREVTRRAHRGWPSILLMALAFGVLLEGVVTQSLFDPDYAHAHLLDHGFLPAIGIAAPWTLYVLTLHTVWSISVPILLVEELAGEQRTQPWLGRGGLVAMVVLLVLGALVSGVDTARMYAFRASAGQLTAVLVVAAILVLLALVMPVRHRAGTPARQAPSPAIVFALAFVAAGLFIGLAAELSAGETVGLDLVLCAAVAFAVVGWSHLAGWGPPHRFALAAAALSTYAWHSFLTAPLVPAPRWLDLISHMVFAAGAVALIVSGARSMRPMHRVRATEYVVTEDAAGARHRRGGQEAGSVEPGQAAMTPAVRCQQLRCAYGDTLAVDGVDLEVRPGEIFGLLGPNGAGKTTTIRALATLLTVPAETVWMFGLDVRRQKMAVRRLIGYVPQLLSADGALTGRENVALFARLYDVPRRDRPARIDDVLTAMGLTEAADRPGATYSGGMIRRLELAQALVSAPQLLILDEPTIGLDPVARAGVWDRIIQVRAERGMTVLVTTHYMDEAEHACDRVAMMHRGRIQVVGTPEELIAGIGDGSTSLDDVFRAYAGEEWAADPKGLRHVQQSRRTASRLA